MRLHRGGLLIHRDAVLGQDALAHLGDDVLCRLRLGIPGVDLRLHRGGVGVKAREVRCLEGPLLALVEGQDPRGDLVVEIPAGVVGHAAVVPLDLRVDLVGVDDLVSGVALHGLLALDLRRAELHVVLIIGHVDAGEALQMRRVFELPGQVADRFGVVMEPGGAFLAGHLERDDAFRQVPAAGCGLQQALAAAVGAEAHAGLLRPLQLRAAAVAGERRKPRLRPGLLRALVDDPILLRFEDALAVLAPHGLRRGVEQHVSAAVFALKGQMYPSHP